VGGTFVCRGGSRPGESRSRRDGSVPDIRQAAYHLVRIEATSESSEHLRPCAGKIRSREIAIEKVCLLLPLSPLFPPREIDKPIHQIIMRHLSST
jgi:hypothetical protein